MKLRKHADLSWWPVCINYLGNSVKTFYPRNDQTGTSIGVFLVLSGDSKKGIGFINFSPLICLHLDICLVNSWNAVFNCSLIHVYAHVRCLREVSLVCVLWLLIISKQDLFHEDFQMPSQFVYFFNSSAMNSWILLMIFSSRGWDILANYRNKKDKLGKCSLFQVGMPY